MSQPNRSCQPSFQYTVDQDQYPYDGQIPQLNLNPAQQWMPSPRPRSAQGLRNQAPSPSGSIQTTRTAPNIRRSDGMSYLQMRRSPVHHGLGPIMPSNLSLLTPYYRGYDPIARQMQDQSWTPYNMRTSNNNEDRSLSRQSDMNYRRHSGPGSDVDSQVLPSDEGYHSQMTTQSLLSNEPGRPSQDLSTDMLVGMGNMNVVETVPSEGTVMSRMPSDQRSQLSGRSGKSSKTTQCHVCGETSTCNSNYRKHMLKHEKPFKCEIAGCKRADKGFTTINDLDRHKKSVHLIGLQTRSYQCAAQYCKNRAKVWPRLDNFKQHVERMHKEEDPLDLINRSTLQPGQLSSSLDDDLTVSPMDTSFAVAGMEKSFSAHPAMTSMHMLDPPSEQDARRWSSFGEDPDGITRNAYPMTGQRSSLTSAPQDTRLQEAQRVSHDQPHIPVIPRRQNALAVPGRVSKPGQRPSKPSLTKIDGPFSNAPQTKSEQQRSALQKLSQAVASSISSSTRPVDLEELILNILHQATGSAKYRDMSSEPTQPDANGQNSIKRITLSKGDALRATQAMANLIKGSPGSANTVPRRSGKGFMPNAKICPVCELAVARDCDLRKHMKRHEKPYGCTYPKCHKRFGAKSDFKRHESSQHFQLEAFRCAEIQASGATCGAHEHREEAFRNHLKTQHNIPPEELPARIKRSKIGKNCQGSFWCGFCQVVRQLSSRRNAAWDERFNHIAHHFEKEKKNIDEWVCVEENRPKRELEKESDRYVWNDEEDKDKGGDVDAAGDVDDDVPLLPPPPPAVVPEISMPKHAAPPPPPPPPTPRPSETSRQEDSRKRGSLDAQPGHQRRPKRRKTTLVTTRYCVSYKFDGAVYAQLLTGLQCSCHSMCGVSDVACVNCTHVLCRSCKEMQEETFGLDLLQ
ncbi:hypothetical protein BDW02DRAFT_491271 [Decorospora gaudefroyi]|uniref:C2H2-type domain-containing protein n=1 Tax=Decorospora gaudefroyi TaxID=184978 RepID=A0A6A5KV26_9PLEO|nr:hypothetical protein BDW02DRAFT_491271 [Decorospora gaudefroyi]